MARLSVNLNKIALLRNSRRTGVPDLCAFARIAIEAGARGITVHPRPTNGTSAAPTCRCSPRRSPPGGPAVELNIEGYPDARLLEIAAEVRAGAVHAGARCAGRVHLRGRLPAGPRADGAGASRNRGAAGEWRARHPVHRSGSRCWSAFRTAAPTVSKSTPAAMPRRSATARMRPSRLLRDRRSGGASVVCWSTPATISICTTCRRWLRGCPVWPRRRSATS